jgi:hypothetical protein
LKTAYRKLALRVHPDKVQDESEKDSYNKAFTRLDGAKDAIETMLNADGEACRELHKVLRFEVSSRSGAAELLGVDAAATTDTDTVVSEAEKAAKRQIKRMEKMEVSTRMAGVAEDYILGVAICNEAVETLRRPCSAEALPRQEALLRVGLPTSRAMGARDLRFPSSIVLMEPQSACWHVSNKCRLAMLCGATAAMSDEQLLSSTSKYKRMPKTSALRWCLDADAEAPTVGAMCIRFNVKGSEQRKELSGPAAKRLRSGLGGQQKAGTIFLRHILFRHQQLKIGDPRARREGVAKGPGEAEIAALACLEKLLANPAQFTKLCKELSDCQTADQAGQLAGHLGWVARGEQESALEERHFS